MNLWTEQNASNWQSVTKQNRRQYKFPEKKKKKTLKEDRWGKREPHDKLWEVGWNHWKASLNEHEPVQWSVSVWVRMIVSRAGISDLIKRPVVSSV